MVEGKSMESSSGEMVRIKKLVAVVRTAAGDGPAARDCYVALVKLDTPRSDNPEGTGMGVSRYRRSYPESGTLNLRQATSLTRTSLPYMKGSHRP